MKGPRRWEWEIVPGAALDLLGSEKSRAPQNGALRGVVSRLTGNTLAAQQFRQLGDIRRNPSRLIARERCLILFSGRSATRASDGSGEVAASGVR